MGKVLKLFTPGHKLIAFLCILTSIGLLFPFIAFGFFALIVNSFSFLFTGTPPLEFLDTRDLVFNLLLFFIAPAILLALNLLSALKLLRTSNPTDSSIKLGLLASSISFCLLIFFPGYFFTSELFFPLIIFLFVALLLYSSWNKARPLGVFLAIAVLLTSAYSFQTSFEEDYCWKKGDEAQYEVESKGESIWIPVRDDEKKGIGESNQVSVAYRAHMDCHKNFNFKEALNEKYNVKI